MLIPSLPTADVEPYNNKDRPGIRPVLVVYDAGIR